MCPIIFSIKLCFLYFSCSLIIKCYSSLFPSSLIFGNFVYKAAYKSVFFIISTLLCEIAQLYNESVLEISLDEDINASFVPEIEPFKEDPLDALLKWSTVKMNQ